MSLLDRQERREIRQRGAARRNVSVDDFTIDPNRVNKKKIASKHNSSIIKKELIENANPSSIPVSIDSKPLDIPINEDDIHLENDDFNDQPFDFNYDATNNDDYRDESIKYENRDNDIINSPQYKKSENGELSLGFSNVLKTPVVDQNKTKKKESQSIEIDRVTQSSKSSSHALEKNHKSVKSKIGASNDRIAKISKTRIRTLRSRKITISEPIPLTKTKIKQKQKPLYVDLVRISNEEKPDKRLKIHTLDVLKYFIKNFEPQSDTNRTNLNEDLLHTDFKTHLINNLENLMDIIASTNDILSRLTEVQKLKNIFRSKILEVRKEHSEIGNKLNQLRTKYNNERNTFNEFNKIHSDLQEVTSKIKTASNNENYDIKNALYYPDFSILKNTIHPKLGLSNKLSYMNEKLQQVNEKL